jgi:RNA polymerase sigma factor (TIGR02999 family)
MICLDRARGARRHARRTGEVGGTMSVPPDQGSTPPRGDPPASADGGARAGAELDDVFPLVYEELRRVAHRHLRGERTEHTLGTTALVHEAYLELAKVDQIRWPGHAYVLAAASRAMRRVLIDYAVARRAQKRGGGVSAEPLDDAVAMAVGRGDELLALDEALDRLTAVNERYGRVVECRFYGGMSVEETAEALGTSPATVKRDWMVARAWLNRALSE